MRLQRFRSLAPQPSNNCWRWVESLHRFAMLANVRVPAPLKRIRSAIEISAKVITHMRCNVSLGVALPTLEVRYNATR
jgi:hypothetical protein